MVADSWTESPSWLVYSVISRCWPSLQEALNQAVVGLIEIEGTIDQGSDARRAAQVAEAVRHSGNLAVEHKAALEAYICETWRRCRRCGGPTPTAPTAHADRSVRRLRCTSPKPAEC